MPPTKIPPTQGPRPPFSFIVEELENCLPPGSVRTKPMFGCHALYFHEKIIFMLRRKADPKTIRDDGVWVASLPEHVQSLTARFPFLRGIELFPARSEKGFSGWLNLPESAEDFEETALALCQLVVRRDPRIGKVPKSRIRKTNR